MLDRNDPLIPDPTYRNPENSFTTTILRRAVVEAGGDRKSAVISIVVVEDGSGRSLYPYRVESAYGRQTRRTMAEADAAFDAEVARLHNRI